MERMSHGKISYYLFVAVPLIVFELLYISHGQWVGDFWEHSAVVNELSRHLVHPNNPIIKSSIPHAFFSPYALLVAVFSRITHTNSIQSLACFAVFNLFFFLFSFYFFCKSVFRENHNLIAALSLIFMLFFWGQDPYRWSGFYHIMVLNLVLPYPSTFAISISFLILSIIARNNIQNYYSKQALLIILSAVVFITHPTTAIFLFIAIVSLNFSYNNNSIKQCILKSAIIIIPSLILCLFWPYYHVIGLLHGNISDFQNDSGSLYSRVFKVIWPILFILPGLFFISKDRTAKFFFSTLFVMLVVFTFGYLFKIYGVSRLMSNIMMFAHFTIAYLIVFLMRGYKLYRNVYAAIVVIAMTASIYYNYNNFNYAFPTALKSDNVNYSNNVNYYDKYNFLNDFVQPDDIIFSDASSNWYIPSFSGKVIASNHPLYWIKDIGERRADVATFFEKETPDSLRERMIKKYQPDYLLINYADVHFDSSTIQWLKTIGNDVYEKNQLELIKIEK